MKCIDKGKTEILQLLAYLSLTKVFHHKANITIDYVKQFKSSYLKMVSKLEKAPRVDELSDS